MIRRGNYSPAIPITPNIDYENILYRKIFSAITEIFYSVLCEDRNEIPFDYSGRCNDIAEKLKEILPTYIDNQANIIGSIMDRNCYPKGFADSEDA